jgi:hypothetical protein
MSNFRRKELLEQSPSPIFFPLAGGRLTTLKDGTTGQRSTREVRRAICVRVGRMPQRSFRRESLACRAGAGRAYGTKSAMAAGASARCTSTTPTSDLLACRRGTGRAYGTKNAMAAGASARCTNTTPASGCGCTRFAEEEPGGPAKEIAKRKPWLLLEPVRDARKQCGRRRRITATMECAPPQPKRSPEVGRIVQLKQLLRRRRLSHGDISNRGGESSQNHQLLNEGDC